MEAISCVRNGTTHTKFIDKADVYQSYTLSEKINVDSFDTWVLDLALNDKKSCSSFAVALSNFSIKVFSVETKREISVFKGHENKISGILFSKANKNLLYSSSQDASIRLWDLRVGCEPVKTFVDNSDNNLKPILSFDLNLDENYICGGTELIREDAFLIFWDTRTSTCLGGYWNSHTEDITQVKYHPFKNCVMASGAMDGLINIFDLSQSTESDALSTTLNTGSSVGKLMWKPDSNSDKLFCMTHADEIQAWRSDDAHPYFTLEKNSFHEKTGMNVDYLVDTLQDDDQVFIVSGNRSNKLQIWSHNDSEIKLWSHIDNTHKEDTRAIAWTIEDKTLFTGGEDGTVCIWKTIVSEHLKISSGLKKSRLKQIPKPY